MRQLYQECHDDTNLQQLVGEIPWGQTLAIMAKVKDRDARQYNLRATIEIGWSRNVLAHQVESQANESHHLADKQHDFQKALPEHLGRSSHEG